MKQREIKFKALFEQERDLGNILRWEYIGVNDSMDNLLQSYLNQKSSWLQFSGLHDKNGKEIYEGDILKKGSAEYRAIIGMYWIKGFQQYGFHLQVNYNPKHIGFSDMEFDLSVLEGIEVIGNIYGNEGLLAVTPINTKTNDP